MEGTEEPSKVKVAKFVATISYTMRCMRDEGGLTKAEMGDALPRAWRDGEHHQEDIIASGDSGREMWVPHDAHITNCHKLTHNSKIQANRVQYDRFITCLEGLPLHARPPEDIGRLQKSESRELTKSKQWGQ